MFLHPSMKRWVMATYPPLKSAHHRLMDFLFPAFGPACSRNQLDAAAATAVGAALTAVTSLTSLDMT